MPQELNNDYILVLQKTTELSVRVSNIETTLQNNAHHTNQALVGLRDELIRTTTEVKNIVTNLSNTVSNNREGTDSKIAKAIKENNELMDAKYASNTQLASLSTKIDRLSTKISLMGAGVVFLVGILAWLAEHPEIFAIFK